MRMVILATLPGLAAQIWFFGWGNLINVLWCGLLAMGAEAAVLALRRRPIGPALRDGSALLTGVLLGLALPPLAPWWLSLVAVLVAIILAKQLYGGLGYNPFNPAMVGYAMVLVSFPVAMTTLWGKPVELQTAAPGLLETLRIIFTGHADLAVDGFTMATPLDVYKHEIGVQLADSVRQHPAFGDFVARGWEWVNLGFLLGGLYLLYRRVISWHIPVSFLLALSVMALLWGWDADRHTPISLHLLAGATMLGAFFIATDPVSAAASPLGKLIYGTGIGVLVYVIRTWGGYPDAVAFAVLLMNFAAPFIDHYTQPRTYGHAKARRGPATR